MTHASYRNKRVVVTGCSSGVGQAAARALVGLGAEVIGLSRRRPAVDVAAFHSVDLGSVESIDAAAAGIDGRIDALFNCAGAPATLPSTELVKVNFLGPRLLTQHLTEHMVQGSAIVNVTSSVACGWRRNLARLQEFIAIETFSDGFSWYQEHEHIAGHGYPFSKEALTVWTMQQSSSLITRGIRINSSSPGAVQTPFLEVSEKAFPPELLAASLHPMGRSSTVDEQVAALLFLNSDSSSYVNGADLAVDGGYAASQALLSSTS